jgi:hypothetical protein
MNQGIMANVYVKEVTMKRILVGSSLVLLMAASGFAAGKGPEIQIVDGKVSIQADSLKLSQFLHLLDAATGMTSKVAPTLANEKISVRLEGLDLDAAIRKSFQGQPWNYIINEGKGINIIDRAAAVTSPTGGSSSSPIQPLNDSRNDNPPPPVPSTTFTQPPVPPANGGNTPNQPAGAINVPPPQGGAPAAQAPLFQPIGGALGAPLPGATPGR